MGPEKKLKSPIKGHHIFKEKMRPTSENPLHNTCLSCENARGKRRSSEKGRNHIIV